MEFRVWVEQPDPFPGCLAQGDTLDDALGDIREAIEVCLEDMRERGEAWPNSATTLLSEVAVEV